jgi:hypothetical protein
VLEVVVHGDDVRVAQRAGDARLAAEAARDGGLADGKPAQLLEGDEAIELGLAGEVHGGHPPAPEDRQKLVAADDPRGSGSGSRARPGRGHTATVRRRGVRAIAAPYHTKSRASCEPDNWIYGRPMAYDWGTQWPGVFALHADRCPVAEGGECTCGPLGYTASLPDPDTFVRTSSPLLRTPAEASEWRREQERSTLTLPLTRPLVDDKFVNGTGNGNGNGNGRPTRVPRFAVEPELEPPPAEQPARTVRRRSAPVPEPGLSVPQLIDDFLDAAEDGEARGSDGRPFSDEELAELGWALTGYVEPHLGGVDAADVRGRDVFRLIDQLEDADMPSSRLRSVMEAMRELFDYAADRGLVRANPARYIAPPPDDRRPRRRLTETLEARGVPPPRASGPLGDAVSEATIWFIVKIIALVFICIALVLVAESV